MTSCESSDSEQLNTLLSNLLSLSQDPLPDEELLPGPAVVASSSASWMLTYCTSLFTFLKEPGSAALCMLPPPSQDLA
jgi:hypothetical protein